MKKLSVVDEDSSFNQHPKSLPLVFDSVKNFCYFSPLNDSNSFGTVDYDAQINTKMNYSINHVFKSMSIQELNT